MYARSLSAFACSLLLSFSVLAAPTEVFLIKPGASAGKVKLDMTQVEVRKALGKPQESFKLDSKGTADVWRTKDVVQVFYKSGKVVQIAVSSPSFQTADGSSAKSTAAQINKRFKDVEVIHVEGRQGVKAAYLSDRKSGLAFYYSVPGENENDFSAWKSEMLIVHAPGAKVQFQPDEEEYEPHPGE